MIYLIALNRRSFAAFSVSETNGKAEKVVDQKDRLNLKAGKSGGKLIITVQKVLKIYLSPPEEVVSTTAGGRMMHFRI